MRGRSGIEGKFFLDGSLVYRPTVSYWLINPPRASGLDDIDTVSRLPPGGITLYCVGA